MLRTVRARTTALATVVTSVALLVGATALLARLHTSLVEADDAVSKSRLHDLIALAEAGALPRSVDAGDGVAQVVDGDGRVRTASDNIPGKPALTSFRPPTGAPVVLDVVGPDDDEQEHYRLWAQRTVTRTGEFVVFSGASTESADEAVAAARRPLLLGLPVLLAVLVLATWLLVGRALRPVESIRAEVAELTARRLDRRVPVPHSRDEIERLARTMNDMLDRLEDASRRQRAFVADASHDLQSPLAALRAELETAGPDPVAWRQAVQRMLAETGEMEALVRNLLLLARLDEGDHGPFTPVDLDDVVREEVARLRPGTTVRLVTDEVSAGPVHGHRADLRRLVRNLLENAVRHAAASVRLRLFVQDATVHLEVHDDGPGVAPADRARIFDRFHKADTARARRQSGAGLGLAIARAVAQAHGGTLTLADADVGARFVLRLPVLAGPSPLSAVVHGDHREPLVATGDVPLPDDAHALGVELGRHDARLQP